MSDIDGLDSELDRGCSEDERRQTQLNETDAKFIVNK